MSEPTEGYLDGAEYRVAWETVQCPTCFAVAGLACENEDAYRQGDHTHAARVRDFYDLTEYRGQ